MRFACASTVTSLAFILAGSGSSAATIESFGRSEFAAMSTARYSQGEDFDDVPLGPIADTSPVTISASEGAVVVTSLFLTTSGSQGIGWGAREYFSSGQSVTFNFTIAISAFAIDINTYATENGAFMASFGPGFGAGPQRADESSDTAAVAYSRFDPFPKPNSKGAFLGQFLGFSSETPFRSVTLSKVSKGTFTLDSLQFIPDPLPVPVPVPAGVSLLAGALALMVSVCVSRRPRRHPA